MLETLECLRIGVLQKCTQNQVWLWIFCNFCVQNWLTGRMGVGYCPCWRCTLYVGSLRYVFILIWSGNQMPDQYEACGQPILFWFLDYVARHGCWRNLERMCKHIVLGACDTSLCTVIRVLSTKTCFVVLIRLLLRNMHVRLLEILRQKLYFLTL